MVYIIQLLTLNMNDAVVTLQQYGWLHASENPSCVFYV